MIKLWFILILSFSLQHDTLDTEKPIHHVIRDTPSIIALGVLTIILFLYGLLFEVYWRCKGKYKAHKSSLTKRQKKESQVLNNIGGGGNLSEKVTNIESKLESLDDDMKKINKNMESMCVLLNTWNRGKKFSKMSY